MRRKAVTAVVAVLALGLFSTGATAVERRGEVRRRTRQERAAANCEHVWGELQVDQVAGGGPKSAVAESIGTTSGPTNCDHFWQSEGIIGNG